MPRYPTTPLWLKLSVSGLLLPAGVRGGRSTTSEQICDRGAEHRGELVHPARYGVPAGS